MEDEEEDEEEKKEAICTLCGEVARWRGEDGRRGGPEEDRDEGVKFDAVVEPNTNREINNNK